LSVDLGHIIEIKSMSPDLEHIQKQEYVQKDISVNAISSYQGCVPGLWVATDDLAYRYY
jgi:hypothetical protein